MPKHRILVIIVMVNLFLSSTIGAVGAQATVVPASDIDSSTNHEDQISVGHVAVQNTSNTTNASNGVWNNTSENSTFENNTANNSTWDGSWNGATPTTGNGGLLGISPVEFVGSVLEWFAKTAMNEAANRLNWINKVISGMPAPGSPTNPASWANPSNGLWPGVWDATKFSLPIGAVLLSISGAWAFRHKDPYQRRQTLTRVGVGTLMVLLTWLVAPMGLHFGSTLGTAMAPSGGEFLATPGNFAKLELGFLLAVILAAAYTAVIVIGLFVLAAQYFLAHAVVFLWPIAWALRSFDGFPKSLGDFVVYLWGGLIALNIGQAMLLRLIFELPWGTGGVVDSLMGFLGTTAGLAFALIWFPKSMLQQVTAGSAVGLGVSAGSREVGKRTQQAKAKVGDIHETYRTSGRGHRSTDGAPSESHQRTTPADPSQSTTRSRTDTPKTTTQTTLTTDKQSSRRMERERRRTDHAVDTSTSNNE